MKIFFADSSPFGHGRLVNLLTDIEGVEITGYALDGLTAYDLIHKKNPDVVILDIEMPGRSGIELLRQLKRELPSLIVIVLTNASHPQYRKRCTEAGANFFFDKSTEFRKVPEVLRHLLGHSSQTQQTIS